VEGCDRNTANAGSIKTVSSKQFSTASSNTRGGVVK